MKDVSEDSSEEKQDFKKQNAQMRITVLADKNENWEFFLVNFQ